MFDIWSPSLTWPLQPFTKHIWVSISPFASESFIYIPADEQKGSKADSSILMLYFLIFFFKCHSRTNATFNLFISEKVPLQMWQDLLNWKSKYAWISSSFLIRGCQPSADTGLKKKQKKTNTEVIWKEKSYLLIESRIRKINCKSYKNPHHVSHICS